MPGTSVESSSRHQTLNSLCCHNQRTPHLQNRPSEPLMTMKTKFKKHLKWFEMAIVKSKN